MSIADRFHAAPRFSEFVASAEQNATLWADTYRLARVADDAAARARALPGRWHLLVLVEDWCGDAVNTVPFVARLAELADGLEVRVLGRDANPDLMDAHLSPTGGRAIPVVIVYDEQFEEVGWWGSRPRALQARIDAEWSTIEKSERYRHVRTWYARDRGHSTVEEILALLEAAAARNLAGGAGVGT